MAKKITGYIKLQVPAGIANPSPPIGPALGQRFDEGDLTFCGPTVVSLPENHRCEVRGHLLPPPVLAMPPA